MKIYHLQVDNKRDNLTVDCQNPVFGWRVEAEEGETDIRQRSYQIQVWDAQGREAWDSGRVESPGMCSIPYGGRTLRSSECFIWQVTCWLEYHARLEEVTTVLEEGNREPVSGRKLCKVKSEKAWFETGLFAREDWKGVFIGEREDHVYHLYRKIFSCGEQAPGASRVKKAKLYICGLGHFVCWMNGNRVSDHELEPGWTVYDKTCQYVAYDVTEKILPGDNAVLVKLGDGMFHVPGGRYVYYPRSYGKARLLFQLEITYTDGSRQLVVSDASWRMTRSPIQFCCIYGGEDYDGRLWKQEYLYADGRKSPAGDTQEGGAMSQTVSESPGKTIWEPVWCVAFPKGEIRAMQQEPIKVMETYEPVDIRQVEEDVWLYDLGTNFSGWARIRLHTNGHMAGRKVVLSTAEKLGPDGRIDQSVTGKGYAWTYILNEETEQEFAPDFTYTGFRYVEVKGAVPHSVPCPAGSPILTSLTGEFLYPDVEQAGAFWCSNELFNDIHRIVLQAIKSNTKSYFTDCPHREKLGWLEQTHLIGPSIMYNLNVHKLYEKVEGDMADAQRDSGLVPDICPEYVTGFERWHQGFLDSPEWGSACILNPWYVYKRYGDISLLRRYYGVMRRYLDYLGGKTHHQVLHHGLGDWLDIGPCPPHSQNTPVPVVATCIYYYDLKVMEQVAGLLGYDRDAAEYRQRMERVYEEYNLQFLDDQTGRYATGSQAAQAMSLMVGLVPAQYEEKAVRTLKEDVVKRGYAITAGDVGHPFLIAALRKYGMSDVLNRMTNVTDKPGYGYQVANGATTLTEDWDGPDPAGMHGSQNHLMLGSIEEWFYGSIGGVELVRDDLPFDQIRIVPHPEEGVDQAKVWTMHPYGRIAVDWQRTDHRVEVTVQIPPNVTAFLESPRGQVFGQVGSGRHRYSFEG